jgi:uncharacterized protein YhbP (UPF0306 family)
MLEAHSTATLATAGEDGPWAATVFFASDADLNLYFVSDHRTRHGRHLAARPEAVAAIHPDCATWAEVQGLQLTGRVEILEGVNREAGLRCYLAKFHDVSALFERPRGADQETIAERLKAASLYRLKPHWIRLIDNRRGFGYKEELQFGEHD